MKRNFLLEKNIISDYSYGINNKELCFKYKKSRSYIQKVLKEYNIKLRKGCEVSKKYNVNENYFEIINNSDKAYILGLIYADGTISKTTVKINLKKTDSSILFDIASKIHYDDNYQIKNIKGNMKLWKNNKYYYSKPQTLLLLTRKKIVNDLKKYGLTNCKTYKIRFPDIDNIYYNDFIRGYFDGDGCFYTSKKYKNNNRINIISNELFLNDLKNIIECNLKINCIIKKKINDIFTLNIYGNNQVKFFLNWLYDDSGLKLERKYLKYKNEYEK